MKIIQKVAPMFVVAMLLGNFAVAANTVAVEDLTLVGEQITATASPEAVAYSGYSHGSYSHGGYSYGGYSYGGYSYGGYGSPSYSYHGSYNYGGPHAHYNFHSHDHYHNGQFHSHDHYHSPHFGFNAAAGNEALLPEVKTALN